MKKLKELDMSRIIVMAVAVLLTVSPAFAADGDPCADEVGAGYGLCNAYCVAMNCNDPAMQEASDSACDRVLANYIKITGKDTIPCEEPVTACPCFSAADVRDLIEWSLENNHSLGECSIDSEKAIIHYSYESEAVIISPDSHCYFYYGDNNYGDVAYTVFEGFELTPEEISSCREEFNNGTNNCDSGTINP